MPVVNVRFNGMHTDRNEEVEADGNVEVRSNFKISSMSREDKPAGEILRVDFEFEIRYKPNIGDIDLAGYLWFRASDNQTLDDILEEKEDTFDLDQEVVKEISSVVIRESLLESSILSRKLGMPIPLKTPRVKGNVQNTEFKKSS